MQIWNFSHSPFSPDQFTIFIKNNLSNCNVYRIRDPRTLLGTYTILKTSSISSIDTSLIDIFFPIYQHIPEIDADGDAFTVYIFKSVDVGFVLSETLPVIGNAVTVFMTCFEIDIFQCQNYKCDHFAILVIALIIDAHF